MRTTIAIILTAAGVLATAAGAATQDTLSLAANPAVVVYGKTTVVSGTLLPAKANQNVTVQGQACGKANYAKTATVKTTTTGAFTTTQTPTAGINYQAKQKATVSAVVAVKVQPVVQLIRVARGSYTVNVTAGQSLTGKVVLFQRYSKLKKRWLGVKKVVLATSTAGTPKPAMVSSASFKARVVRRARVRVLLSIAQASPCYIGATSNVVRA
jgi:hypothetical protein